MERRSRRGTAGHGVAGPGGQREARRGVVWLGVAGCGRAVEVRRGLASRGSAWRSSRGEARRAGARRGLAVMAWHAAASRGRAWRSGMERVSTAWRGDARPAMRFPFARKSEHIVPPLPPVESPTVLAIWRTREAEAAADPRSGYEGYGVSASALGSPCDRQNLAHATVGVAAGGPYRAPATRLRARVARRRARDR